MKYTEQELIEAVKNSDSINQVLTNLNLKHYAGNHATISNKIKLLKLDISHFYTKQRTAWNKGLPATNKKQLSEHLVINSKIKGHQLKKILLNNKVLIHQCSKCQLTEWQGKPIPIELDHINGDNTDNRLENLRLLCPNCHAQTDTYKGKNKKETSKFINERSICKCGNKKGLKSTGCKSCFYKEHSKCNKPSKEELEVLIHTKTFIDIAKIYNVTDNAIRKWCKQYELPYQKRKINLFPRHQP